MDAMSSPHLGMIGLLFATAAKNRSKVRGHDAVHNWMCKYMQEDALRQQPRSPYWSELHKLSPWVIVPLLAILQFQCSIMRAATGSRLPWFWFDDHHTRLTGGSVAESLDEMALQPTCMRDPR